MRWAALVCVLVAACGSASSHRVYRLPSACGDVEDRGEAERCAAWLVDELMTGRLGVYDDAELDAYVTTVGLRVAGVTGRDDVDWTFRVLDDPGVQAWAGPGGHVYVTRGLLAQLDSEAELGAVLGHEIGHVVAGHTDGLLDDLPDPSFAGFDFSTAFSLGRDDEAQADQLAVRYARRAGYDPRAMPAALEAIYHAALARQEPSWDDRHPPLPVRLALTARAADGTTVGERHERRYLAAIDGMVIGHDPRQGMVVDGRFVHGRGGFSFALPAGWEHRDWEVGTIRSQWFNAYDAENTSGLVLLPLAHPHGDVIEAGLRADMARRPTRPIELAGYDGVEGTLDTEDGREIQFTGLAGQVHVVTFEARDDRSYGLMVLATEEATRPTAEVYGEILASFRREERSPVEPLRLRPRRVAASTTLSDLVAGGCGGAGEAGMVGLLNELAPDDVVDVGRVIKCLGS